MPLKVTKIRGFLNQLHHLTIKVSGRPLKTLYCSLQCLKSPPKHYQHELLGFQILSSIFSSTRTSSTSTGAGIIDYLTSPATVVASKPTKKAKASKAAPKAAQEEAKMSGSVSHQRLVIDGQLKAIVERFTEEGGIIYQV